MLARNTREPAAMAIKEKIKSRISNMKKFKPKQVLSKIRAEAGSGWRRVIWLLVGLILWWQGWTVLSIIRLYLIVAALLFIALPIIFKYVPWIQRNLVFLPFLKWPKNIDFTNPEGEGLPGSRNFYLESDPGVRIGVWHILPADLLENRTNSNEEWFTEQLSDDRPVVLYLHGNSAHRAGPHRVELYNLLRSMNYHVVCFDYRGYADSTQLTPSETAVVSDAKAVFDWVRGSMKEGTKLIVWGHSLGTAVATHLVSDLCIEGNRPSGLVLESPFNNVFDEIRNHPMAWVWRKMPWFDYFFTSALTENDIGFVSDQRITVIDIPVIIMHAQDDALVPFKLGKALYEAALAGRDSAWPKVEFIEFGAEHGYAHKFICRAPELPSIFKQFLERCEDLN